MRTVKVIISGIVQGVGFRYLLKNMADRFKVSGYAKNKIDGTVETIFQGKNEDVEKLIEACKKGPTVSSVEHIEVNELLNSPSYDNFTIE